MFPIYAVSLDTELFLFLDDGKAIEKCQELENKEEEWELYECREQDLGTDLFLTERRILAFDHVDDELAPNFVWCEG
ncbi:MAG: hypothetical protein CMD39_07335 [Gammaproteobacteria bacterium]|nr:hypothetical protein [Gammaproteobacteria bacterium]